jgi:hypothetical protein
MTCTFISYKSDSFVACKMLICGSSIELRSQDILIHLYLVYCLFNHSSKAVKYFELRILLVTDVAAHCRNCGCPLWDT